MQSTIKSIAQMAGVSRGTVDRALNGRPGVKKEVADEIIRIATELGYKPNLAGKVLANKQYRQLEIGVILVTENNPFFNDVIYGIKKAIQEFEEFGIVGRIHILEKYSEEDELNTINSLIEEGVSGLVLKPIVSDKIEKRIQELTEADIPVITLNSDVDNAERLSYVGCDLRKSGRVMAELLSMFTLGKKNSVSMIIGSEMNAGMKERMEGFQEFVSENDAAFNIVREEWTNEGAEMVYEKTIGILAAPERSDYICVMGGGIAGCLKALRQSSGRDLPTVLTYDLTDEVKTGMQDGLIAATITQDPEQQGYNAYQIMARHLAFGQRPSADVNYTNLAVALRSCL